MKKVLITGITGKSGMYMLHEIAKEQSHTKNEYTFIVRSEEKAKKVTEVYPQAQTVIGDIEDVSFIRKVLAGGGYNIVLHIAGIHRTLPLIQPSLDAGIEWLVLVHTTGIYSKYKAAGEGYRLIEKQIREMIFGKDVSLTILRPTMIYGNLRDGNISIFMRMVYKMRLFPVVDHAAYELQPVWCGDLGKAYLQVLNHSEETKNKDYNLSGGRPILLMDIFKVLAQELGVRTRFVSVPFWVAYGGAWLVYLLTFEKKDFREKVQRLVEPRTFIYEEATRDFGYQPLPFEEGIKDEVAQFKVYYHLK